MTFQKPFRGTAFNSKKLFVVDGSGAMLSAFLLGVVLTTFQNSFGMPKVELYALASAACVFAVFDFWCYFRIDKNWRPYLRVIAIVNLLYCFVSAGLVFHFRGELTGLGFLYFSLEIGMLIILACIELKSSASLK